MTENVEYGKGRNIGRPVPLGGEPVAHPEVLHMRPSKVVQISDWRKDLDDTEASIALKYLSTRGEVDLLGGVGTLTPPDQRARAGRYIFDQLGFTNVPVGVGSSSPKVRM